MWPNSHPRTLTAEDTAGPEESLVRQVSEAQFLSSASARNRGSGCGLQSQYHYGRESATNESTVLAWECLVQAKNLSLLGGELFFGEDSGIAK